MAPHPDTVAGLLERLDMNAVDAPPRRSRHKQLDTIIETPGFLAGGRGVPYGFVSETGIWHEVREVVTEGR